MWLVIPALQVSESVLACLALHVFLVVSKLMLQSESIFLCCRCISVTTVMSQAAALLHFL